MKLGKILTVIGLIVFTFRPQAQSCERGLDLEVQRIESLKMKTFVSDLDEHPIAFPKLKNRGLSARKGFDTRVLRGPVTGARLEFKFEALEQGLKIQGGISSRPEAYFLSLRFHDPDNRRAREVILQFSRVSAVGDSGKRTLIYGASIAIDDRKGQLIANVEQEKPLLPGKWSTLGLTLMLFPEAEPITQNQRQGQVTQVETLLRPAR